jgi:hypothetical protein
LELTQARLHLRAEKAGNFKVMTHAMIQFTEVDSANVMVLTDDVHGAEQQQLIQMVSCMKLGR